jgi:hypothetical protein
VPEPASFILAALGATFGGMIRRRHLIISSIC